MTDQKSPRYCPECRSEFRADIDKCSDCDCTLVAELVPEDHTHEKMVSVLDAVDGEQLMVAKSVLDGAGIENLIEDRGATPGVSFGGSFDPAGQPSHLMVPVSQVSAAKALLDTGDD